MLNFLIILLFASTPQNQLREKIEIYLDAKLKGFQKYEFEITSSPKETDVLMIDNDRDFKLSNDVAFIPVKSIKTKGASLSFVTVKVRLFDYAYVAKTNINKRMQLSNEDIELKLIEVSKTRGTVLTKADDVSAYRSKTLIKNGEVLISEILEKIPVVKNGDLVSAHSQYGNVMISIDAIARQEGCVDDVIRIASKDKKLYKAKVIDSKNVSIIE